MIRSTRGWLPAVAALALTSDVSTLALPLSVAAQAFPHSSHSLLAHQPAFLSRQSPVLSQNRLVPNPAGADAFTDGNNRLVWTNSTGQAVLYDLRTKKASVVAVSQSVHGSVAPAKVGGRWLAYLDDPESRWTGTAWLLKVKNLQTGAVSVVGRADGTIPAPIAERLRPTYAISKGRVIWNYWRQRAGRIEAFVGLYDLHSRRLRTLAHATRDNLVDVALSGSLAAWCRIDVAAGQQAARPPVSTLWLEDLRTGRTRRVDVGEGASEAAMWGRYLVYKASPTRYDAGNAYLYDTASGRTQQFSHLAAPNTVDFPTVGASLVVWDGVAGVGAYDLSTKRAVQLSPSGGGRAFTAGHVLLYVASTRPGDPAHGSWALIVDQLR